MIENDGLLVMELVELVEMGFQCNNPPELSFGLKKLPPITTGVGSSSLQIRSIGLGGWVGPRVIWITLIQSVALTTNNEITWEREGNGLRNLQSSKMIHLAYYIWLNYNKTSKFRSLHEKETRDPILCPIHGLDSIHFVMIIYFRCWQIRV